MPARESIQELRPVRAETALARFEGSAVRSRGSPLEPRDAGGIVDLALEGLLARFVPALLFALALWIPFRHAAELLGLSEADALAVDLYALAWNAFSLVPTALAASVAIRLVGDALVDGRTPVAASVRAGLGRGGGALVIVLVTQILTLPLAFCFFVPYLLVQWLTYAALPIYVLEGESLLAPEERAGRKPTWVRSLWLFPRVLARAISRSLALTKGGPSLGRWILLALVGQFMLGGVLELASGALMTPEAREYLGSQFDLDGRAGELLLGTASALFLALGSCLRAALMVAFYLDLRVRREAWDLELALSSAVAAR